jgi:hypothetical protein
MSYFPHRMILIIYSPLPVHEETTSEMSFTISHALHNIQYNRTLLKTSVLTNSRMYSEHLFTIPDMQVTMKPTTTTAAETQLLWMAESGFTQSRVAIMTKMEDTLLSHEELLLILMILVKERKKYASPQQTPLLGTRHVKRDRCGLTVSSYLNALPTSYLGQ